MKTSRYTTLLPQITAILSGETDMIANMANISAALREAFGFLWVGFYIVRHQELVLGPFQGAVACTRIARGRGVCGAAWAQAQTLIVPDVGRFPGHIACSPLSKSEIVVPLFGLLRHVVAVLDIDSDAAGAFDEVDKHFLEKIVQEIKITNYELRITASAG
ncbi:MAG: GAF domain-containing protein [Prevotellaceae bacterium]|jgi:GAF domain-containing protein|nr:GAF domain-containing protein [Prevotellaceae bacterium]